MKSSIKSAVLAGLVLVFYSSIAIAQDAPSTATQEAIDPEKLTAAVQLIDTILPPESRKDMMAAMMRPMMQNMQSGMQNNPELQKDAEVQKIMQKFIQRQSDRTLSKLMSQLPEMVTAMSRAYARQFTLQEMADAKAFFSTPSGRAYMEKAGGVMADPDVAKWQQNMMESGMSDLNSDLKSLTDEIAVHKAKKK